LGLNTTKSYISLKKGKVAGMINGKAKFEQDLTALLSRLKIGLPTDAGNKLNNLKDWLLKLQKENVVKINHSVMELVAAKYLILKGYDVQLEYPLSDLLTCDLYSTKGFGNLVVEIETGFIPPEHALNPLSYTSARLASKIIRYSSFAGKFGIGVPPHYVLPFPLALARPPRRRTQEDVAFIKNLCGLYYQNPPVTEDGIRNARIQAVYIIDVDQGKVKEVDPEAYTKRGIQKDFAFPYQAEEVSTSQKATTLLDFQEYDLELG
jgi:hypothetical protein